MIKASNTIKKLKKPQKRTIDEIIKDINTEKIKLKFLIKDSIRYKNCCNLIRSYSRELESLHNK